LRLAIVVNLIISEDEDEFLPGILKVQAISDEDTETLRKNETLVIVLVQFSERTFDRPNTISLWSLCSLIMRSKQTVHPARHENHRQKS